MLFFHKLYFVLHFNFKARSLYNQYVLFFSYCDPAPRITVQLTSLGNWVFSYHWLYAFDPVAWSCSSVPDVLICPLRNTSLGRSNSTAQGTCLACGQPKLDTWHHVWPHKIPPAPSVVITECRVCPNTTGYGPTSRKKRNTLFITFFLDLSLTDSLPLL